ncbi:hypothetical protein Bdiaspc4_10985 [Bradyrhizobium diazoefficiens]|uniref:Uncharacterized protein n=3 Tax=Bradyrhizobium TaxID=374 RepID=A0A1L3FMY6_BRAJP|nr:hypothetical protein RN69_37365 [Bradyrhizobium japonicum]AND87690.1 hypothetical protein AAV28_07615 [Bradyrhizobium diazoefficiens USDA 110]APG14669.1 hypothetical protein BKD09_40590 [Bradyrhizobium japonicum]QBP20983.1 hypothetical protein Bdiaspc4_10985 [Bradyrhizobium diazoefficiens]
MTWIALSRAILSTTMKHKGVSEVALGALVATAFWLIVGLLVGELRSIRHYSRQQAEHLKAMRAYYEPHGG